MSNVFHRFVLKMAISVLACTIMGASAADVQDVRLYTLDCGRVSSKDTGFLSDIGDLDGKPGEFANPCYLIRHPKGWLLWDTGLGDALAARKGGVDTGDGRVIVPVTLVSQLQAIGVTPDQITYVAFSHHHVDHIGNAGLFTTATWLLNKAELASSAPGMGTTVPFTADKAANTRMIDKNLDVFADGAVNIIATPGHTPGSQSLVLRLAHSGTIILAGDLYASRASRRLRRIPTANSNRAETLASMDRVEQIARLRHAKVIAQHDLQDFETMPKAPRYLD